MTVEAQHFAAVGAVGVGAEAIGIVYASRCLMMSLLLLPGDVFCLRTISSLSKVAGGADCDATGLAGVNAGDDYQSRIPLRLLFR